MSSELSLALTENTSNRLDYITLPYNDYRDIHTNHNPVTLIHCVVMSRDLTSSYIPSCIYDGDGSKFFNLDGTDLFEDEELSTEPGSYDLDDITAVAEEEITPFPPHM